ncbi:hypothetical protein P1J78_05330 [Psychromarinibacter sp. C21-152]|uniref:Uncharacterized protein n=1 Tax=Psychromarinibacter sediminicola TaxID=3033385 RepID=A0AAE3NQC1_9RHOB|nr:hypothetical protein [Psychromarinibacter sediminicola]MDF0600146.1 hypothetical protein [Psychromarinibacter sediminicola]
MKPWARSALAVFPPARGASIIDGVDLPGPFMMQSLITAEARP